MAKNKRGNKEKEFVIETPNTARPMDRTDERVNNCIAEIQAVLKKYNCVIDHYYILHGDKVLPQLKIVPLPDEAAMTQ